MATVANESARVELMREEGRGESARVELNTGFIQHAVKAIKDGSLYNNLDWIR